MKKDKAFARSLNKILTKEIDVPISEELIEEHLEALAPEITEETIIQYHVGSGWYELPSGEKVRGKKAALKALRES